MERTEGKQYDDGGFVPKNKYERNYFTEPLEQVISYEQFKKFKKLVELLPKLNLPKIDFKQKPSEVIEEISKQWKLIDNKTHWTDSGIQHLIDKGIMKSKEDLENEEIRIKAEEYAKKNYKMYD
jgi:hypothetical protein